jgi:hypothetical protein
MTAFFTDGSTSGTALGLICFDGKFDHITIDIGSVLDPSIDRPDGARMIRVTFRRDDGKPGGFFASVSKDMQSVEIGRRDSRKLVSPTTRKLVIQIPRYAESDAQTVFTFPDFKPVTEACRGLFKD